MKNAAARTIAVMVSLVGASCVFDTAGESHVDRVSQPVDTTGWYLVNSAGSHQTFVDSYKGAVGMRLPDDGATDPIAVSHEYLDEDADPSICTAFLVGETLMMSAGHCDFSNGRKVIFDYEMQGTTEPDYQDEDLIYEMDDVLVSEWGGGLDFQVFRIQKRPVSEKSFAAPGHRFGMLDTSTSYSVGTDASIIMHPFEVGEVNCPKCPAKLFAKGDVYEIWNDSDQMLLEGFSITGGASGSPILKNNGKVIGIATGISSMKPRVSAMDMVFANSNSSTDDEITCAPYDTGVVDFGKCSSGCPCEVGEGDCDNDGQCKGSFDCKMYSSSQTPYGGQANLDLCYDPSCPTFDPLSPDYTPNCTLSAGEGDCDNDEECGGPLICRHNVGKAVHADASSSLDICDYPADPGCSPNSCSSACPCGLGEGDCNNDSECREGLICIHNIGEIFGRGTNVDICGFSDAQPSECGSCPSGYYCMENSGLCTAGGYGDACENDDDCSGTSDCCDGSSNCGPSDLGCECHQACD